MGQFIRKCGFDSAHFYKHLDSPRGLCYLPDGQLLITWESFLLPHPMNMLEGTLIIIDWLFSLRLVHLPIWSVMEVRAMHKDSFVDHKELRLIQKDIFLSVIHVIIEYRWGRRRGIYMYWLFRSFVETTCVVWHHLVERRKRMDSKCQLSLRLLLWLEGRILLFLHHCSMLRITRFVRVRYVHDPIRNKEHK